MIGFARLRPAAKAYIIGVVLAGAAAVAQSAYRLYASPLDLQWLILAGLTLLTGFFTVKVPAINARISVSETFVFASVLLFGAEAGTITVLLESLIILFWMPPGGRQPHRLAFNMAAPTVAIWVSGSVFFLFSGIERYSTRATPLPILFLPLAAFTALYFFLNSWLVALAVGLENRTSPYAVWSKNFIWLSVNYFSGASVAALIVTYTRRLDLSTLAVIVPLLVVSYLTFKTAMGRVEDSNRHLSELNQLHLSTIETLAMAIDAKDQITHGHIRRVQSYAVGLAKQLGVVDEKLIKAIEAAALLHDLGKLAVPEHILNKPGKLTPAEFEKMKLHASVGADILAAIAFPYPVVPIVRHHHESWDGTGYPTGLRGTQIPIGARILSVVDCFDALTSDRPYRPRLTDQEALAILIQRRGSMYDPLIVDTFVTVHDQIAPETSATEPHRVVLSEITGITVKVEPPTVRVPRLDDFTASADEMLTLYELSRALAGQASVGDTGDVIATHVRRLIPSSVSVFYSYDCERDDLEAKHVMGEASSVVKGMRIPLGQRLSGWVAANRQTIINSDPVLDLGEVARSFAPSLQACLSTSLVVGDELVGVLTLYSTTAEGFSDDHRRIIELIAREMAHTFKRASEFDDSIRRDPITGLPNVKQLEHFVESAQARYLSGASEFHLLFLDVVDLKTINLLHGRHVGDEALRHVVRHARTCLRLADILFTYGSDEFVALINDPHPAVANSVAERIRASVRSHTLTARNGSPIRVDVEVTTVCPPRDGQALADRIAAARAGRHKESAAREGSTIR